MKIFYISDLHLFHLKCLLFENRPFKDMDEMIRVIVENWKRKVSPTI